MYALSSLEAYTQSVLATGFVIDCHDAASSYSTRTVPEMEKVLVELQKRLLSTAKAIRLWEHAVQSCVLTMSTSRLGGRAVCCVPGQAVHLLAVDRASPSCSAWN